MKGRIAWYSSTLTCSCLLIRCESPSTKFNCEPLPSGKDISINISGSQQYRLPKSVKWKFTFAIGQGSLGLDIFTVEPPKCRWSQRQTFHFITSSVHCLCVTKSDDWSTLNLNYSHPKLVWGKLLFNSFIWPIFVLFFSCSHINIPKSYNNKFGFFQFPKETAVYSFFSIMLGGL